MKKISLLLIGLLVLVTFASSASVLNVATPKSGSQEYFGVIKPIHPAGISWTIGVAYVAGDQLTFSVPSGWTFGTPAVGGAYFLVSRSTNGTLYADEDGDGTPEWSFFAGGPTTASITFRVTDAIARPFTGLGSWFLCTLSTTALAGGSIPVNVPAGVVPGSPAVYKITATANAGIGGASFDAPKSTTILSVYPEFSAVLNTMTATIDVLYQRMKFLGGVLRAGGDNLTITQNPAVVDYKTTLGATDYFRNTVTGDMTGVSYAKFYATTKTPATTTTAVVNVPGGAAPFPGAFGVAGSAIMVVNGTTTLNNRSFTDTIDFVPATTTWWGRNLLTAAPFQTWITNGTVFRSVFFATSIAAGNYSAFRLANHSTVAADVWADVWLDDGQKTTISVKVGTIPALADGGRWSINGNALAVAAGLLPDANMTDGSWRGRVIFTVWSPADTTFGTELYQVGGLGYTEIALEKQTNTGTAWWEK